MSRKAPERPRKSRTGPVRDWHLWSAVGRTVAPISKRKSSDPKALLEELEAALNPPPEPQKPTPRPLPRLAPSLPSTRPVLAAAVRQGQDKPIEPGLRKRLQRGHLPIDATLDLHGMTQDEAQETLLRFLPARAARGDRTILVITGKGLKKTGYLQIEQKGILRAMLPGWLRHPALAPLVAGVEPAHQSHGGEGAFYVRLKRLRPERTP